MVASASVGALLQNRLALALHDRAVAAPTQLPGGVAGHFVSGFSNAAHGGLEVGAGQTGTNLTLPAGVPASVGAQVNAAAHSVFTNGFVDAMRPTLILPIAIILLAAGATTAVRVRRPPESGAAIAEPAEESRDAVAAA